MGVNFLKIHGTSQKSFVEGRVSVAMVYAGMGLVCAGVELTRSNRADIAGTPPMAEQVKIG